MNGKTVPPSADFMDFLAIIAGNIGEFTCQVNVKCNIVIQDLSKCQGQNPGLGNEPYIYFMIQTLLNFYNWQDAVRKVLVDQRDRFTSKADHMVLQFTNHHIEEVRGFSELSINEDSRLTVH